MQEYERKEVTCMNMLKRFWQEEDGIATVELLLILAALIAIALFFKNQIMTWVQTLIEKIFKVDF